METGFQRRESRWSCCATAVGFWEKDRVLSRSWMGVNDDDDDEL